MENKVLPIKPEKVLIAKQINIPDQIFEAVNEMIINKWDGNSATLIENDLMELILQKFDESNLEIDSEKIYKNHWLDIEDIYREQGWNVVYDMPYYNENYPARFIFKCKNK